MKKKKFNLEQTLFSVIQLELLTTNLRKYGTFPTKDLYKIFGDIEKIIVNYSQKMETTTNEKISRH